jgi:hypothetical protein
MDITQIKLYSVNYRAYKPGFSLRFKLIICLVLLSFTMLTVSGEEQQDDGKYGNFLNQER